MVRIRGFWTPLKVTVEWSEGHLKTDWFWPTYFQSGRFCISTAGSQLARLLPSKSMWAPDQAYWSGGLLTAPLVLAYTRTSPLSSAYMRQPKASWRWLFRH